MSDKDYEDQSSEELAEERTEKADDRTDMALQRTMLANERTFAGWGRTAFASIALGLGFQAVFKAIDPTWVPKLISSLFILLGIFIIWLATVRARQLVANHEEEMLTNRGFFVVLAICISSGGLGLLISLWVLL